MSAARVILITLVGGTIGGVLGALLVSRYRRTVRLFHAARTVTAPFTVAQVGNINRWQTLGYVHPLTCGREGCREALQAFPAGLMCPDPACGYMQSWVHEFIANGGFPTK